MIYSLKLALLFLFPLSYLCFFSLIVHFDLFYVCFPQMSVDLWIPSAMVCICFKCVPRGSCIGSVVTSVTTLESGGILKRWAWWEVGRSLGTCPWKGLTWFSSCSLSSCLVMWLLPLNMLPSRFHLPWCVTVIGTLARGDWTFRLQMCELNKPIFKISYPASGISL